MQKDPKSPYNFDGCYICSVSRQAVSKGASLSEIELVQAFKVQAVQSKVVHSLNAKSTLKQTNKQMNKIDLMSIEFKQNKLLPIVAYKKWRADR